MSRDVTVAITSVSGGDTPSPGLVVAQTLRGQRAMALQVVVLAADPLIDGIQAVHVADRIATVPPPAREPEAFVDAVAALAREASPLVLVPGTPEDARVLACHQPALRRAGVRALLPSPARLDALALPRAARIMRVGHRGRAPIGIELSVVSVAARAAPSALAVARLLEVSSSGVVWSAVTVADPRLVGALTRAMTRLRWRGAAEARFVLDRHRRLWLTALAPGFASWVSLAAAAGQDIAIEYVRLALGRAPGPAGRFTEGLMLARIAVDRITTIETLRHLVAHGGIAHGT